MPSRKGDRVSEQASQPHAATRADLAAALWHADVAVAVWNDEDRLVAFNRRFVELFPEVADQVRPGVPFDALLYRAIQAGAVPAARHDSKDWMRRRIAAHRAPGAAFEVETGLGRWLRVSETRLADGSTVSTWTDITELKRDALQHRLNEERYRSLVDNAPVTLLVHADGRVVFVNQEGARRFAAAAPEALIGRPVASLLDRGAGPASAAEAVLAGEAAPVEAAAGVLRFRRLDGAPLWLAVQARRLDGADHDLVLVSGSDVTGLQAASAEAATAVERLATAIDGVPELIALFDADDRLVLANRASRAIEAALGELWRPGVDYETYLRAAVARGLYPQAEGCADDWIARRLDQHRSPSGPVELARQDGRWLSVNERRLADGSVISIASDVTEHKSNAQQIRFLAHHDALTGLPNRSLFQDRLEQALALARRDGRKVAVLLLDLDHFKHINDNLGHAAGDRVLVEVAARLRGCARGGDTVARLGGDEFAVIQTQVADAEQAAALAQRALAALSGPVVIDGQPVHTGASVGITLFPDDAGELGELMKNADLALHRAKALAPGRLEFYASEMTRQAQQRMAVTEGLRRALAEDQFVLHYQPTIRLADGVVIGGEALLRWHRPEQGLVAPAEFIAHAEATGLILALGEWALDRCCTQLAEWARKGHLMVPVWVNVSAAQFRDQALLDKVRASLLGAGVEARMLGLEITESALMPDVAQATATLNRLVELGVELSIDDFGTGYSSLNYLKKFPVGKLKIDQSFVRDITSNPLDSAIARAIIHLGHSLGMHVLAEGVETTRQANLLSDLGCDEIQGRLVSAPLPADEFVRFVARAAGLREPRL